MENDKFRLIRASDGILSQQVAEQIRQLILSGQLKPEERLPSERGLSQQFGVSRTAIREAIKILRAAGLVRIRLGVGTFVAEPDQNILQGPLGDLPEPETKKIEDLMQVRAVLEPAIAALAAKNATQEQVQRLDKALLEMEQNLSDGRKYIEADNLFHIALANASNNLVFELLENSIVDLFQESRRLAVSNPGATERARKLHERVFHAIQARDPDAAYIAMEKHMQQTVEDVWATMNRKRSARLQPPKRKGGRRRSVQVSLEPQPS